MCRAAPDFFVCFEAGVLEMALINDLGSVFAFLLDNCGAFTSNKQISRLATKIKSGDSVMVGIDFVYVEYYSL